MTVTHRDALHGILCFYSAFEDVVEVKRRSGSEVIKTEVGI